MKIFPSDKIEITTSLSLEEVRTILTNNIRQKTGVIFGSNNSKNTKLFEGSFEQDRFEIQCVITGRNSFLPQIKGHIRPSMNGTKLIADLTIHKFVIGFMVVWFSLVTISLIFGSTSLQTNPIFLLVPLIMIAFGIVLVKFGYNIQKNKSISDLKMILNGKLIHKNSI